MVEIRLPTLPPSVNALWRAGRGRVYRSPAYTSWLSEASWLIAAQRPQKITGRYILSVWATRPDKRRRDLDNLLKATSDLLGRMRIVEDDSLCEALEARWLSDGNGMVLRLEPIDVDSQKAADAFLGRG